MSQDELKHYGILRESGRYEWGSGKDEYSRSMKFYQIIDVLKNKGLKEDEIAKALGMSMADVRSTRTIAKEQIVLEETQRATKLRAKGMSPKEIAKKLDMAEPTVRLRLQNSENQKKSSLRNTANIIRENVDKHGIVDIGKGTEHNVLSGIADTRLRAAIAVLRDEGYETYNLPVRQVAGKNVTNQKVIVPPGTGFGNARRMTDKIHTMGEWTEDDGATWFGIRPVVAVNPKRLVVKHLEDGGDVQDGVVHVRPGVKDLSMGKNTYAQVRIRVGDSHFIKGMAVLNPDLPEGVDLVFHTNKPRSVGKLGALKPLERDKDGNVDEANPFGSVIKRQILAKGKDGVEKAVSALNLVNEEGDWNDWRKSLPSQMLAKQPHSLIKSQLTETRSNVKARLDEINQITNPVIRRKKLEDFAEQIDSDGVELRAAAMPRQMTQVIIPMPKMAKNEIYAPNFETGESVVLIRFPHGGRFEIPEVTVNNNNRTAKKMLGNATDAIGIHPSVAARLSGADFDGDTVVVIPNKSGSVKGIRSMGSQAKVYDDGLKNFEPKTLYGGFVKTGVDKDGNDVGNFPLMRNTGREMGMITNLITDMSIQAAKPEHVVRAVKHSMVVIDAEKHKLNYKKSEQDNNIKQLRELYQLSMKPDGTTKAGGATTLLSKATADVRIPDRKLRPQGQGGPIDPKTGAKVWVDTGKTRSVYDPKTQTYSKEKVLVTGNAKRLELTDDAFSLVRDKTDPVEKLYASHANEMKALANSARLQASRIPSPPMNKKAKAVYKPEVDKLVGDLKAAEASLPLFRRADVIAGAFVKARRQEDPLLRTDPERLMKVERQAKAAARARLGLQKPTIEITDRQWDAIQSGAISASRLKSLLKYADPKRVTELSMPKANPVMTSAIMARAKSMLAAGGTNADIARALGIAPSTLRAAALRGDL